MKQALGTRWTTALGGLLLGFLALLGLWQVRWIDTWSKSEVERMRRFAATGVDRVALDLDRELRTLGEIVRQASGTPEDELHEPLLAAAKQAADERCSVDRFLWLDPRAPGQPYEVLPEEARIVPFEWEHGLEAWRRVAVALTASDGDTALHLPDSPPAMLIPILPVGQPGSLSGGRAGPRRMHFALLLLNADGLRSGLLADLVQRHVGRSFADDMRVLVSYGSGVVLDTHPGTRFQGGVDAQSARGGGRLRIGGGTSEQDLSIELEGGRDTLEVRELESVDRGPVSMFDSPSRAPLVVELPGWRVVAQHVAGSIDAAVAATRRRNFALGLGILTVLACAAILLVLAARRARLLAERQVEFVAGVTHELRTPLAVIRSAAENLRDCVVTEPEHAQRYGAMIHDEARRLGDFVEGALSLAGANASAPSRRADLATLVEGALERCRRRSGEASEVSLDIQSGVPAVLVEPVALGHALDNLLANALKYGGDPAQVGVRVRAGRDDIEVTVWDRGPGVPAEERGRLFEPFFRGRDARRSQVPGSGLGLAVVRRAMESQGGSVSVETEEGAGAAFTLHLRKAPA